MSKKCLAVLLGALLALSLAGCGTSQNNTQSQNKKEAQSTSTSQSSQTEKQVTDTSKQSKDNSMKGMNMDNQPPVGKAIQDELNGLTTVEQAVNKGDYKTAATIAENLHNEFHAAIVPPLKAKKGATYAEDIHGKYDALQDAVKSKDKTQITELIKVNRDNLTIVSKVLGVSAR